jgi:hypothetical protein
MHKDLKAVIDCNVWISILLGSRHIAPIYSALLNESFSLVITPSLLNELTDVTSRPQFNLPLLDIKDLISILNSQAIIVNPAKQSFNICRDPMDEYLLCAALEANANCIVTGDKDLLCLNPFRGIPILTPAEFIKKFL